MFPKPPAPIPPFLERLGSSSSFISGHHLIHVMEVIAAASAASHMSLSLSPASNFAIRRSVRIMRIEIRGCRIACRVDRGDSCHV